MKETKVQMYLNDLKHSSQGADYEQNLQGFGALLFYKLSINCTKYQKNKIIYFKIAFLNFLSVYCHISEISQN